jgi:arylsulfatase
VPRPLPLLPLFLALACGAAPPASAPGDVLLVVIDTLRADRVGLLGSQRDTTPHIDRFFAGGAVYRRAYGAEASTSPSVVSILSGRLPQDHGVRLFYQLLPDSVEILPDLLPRAYQTAAFVSNLVLTDEALGLGDRFDHYDDFVDERESQRLVFERRAERTTDAVLRWLGSGPDPERPLFLWVHYVDPHGPYRAPGSWRRRFRSAEVQPIPPGRISAYMRQPEVVDGNDYVDRYDSEVAYVDAQVGRLLEGFAASRGLERALVILTADHGESMMEHEYWFAHGYHVYEGILRVPLLLRGPGVEAGHVDVPVSGVDLAGTILAFAGAEPPAGVASSDLRRPQKLDPGRTVFGEAVSGIGKEMHRAAYQGDRKVRLTLRGPDARISGAGLFDLRSDPGEQHGRPPPDDDRLMQELRAKIAADPDPTGVPEAYRRGIQLMAPKVAPRVSEEDLARLRELGYAE